MNSILPRVSGSTNERMASDFTLLIEQLVSESLVLSLVQKGREPKLEELNSNLQAVRAYVCNRQTWTSTLTEYPNLCVYHILT